MIFDTIITYAESTKKATAEVVESTRSGLGLNPFLIVSTAVDLKLFRERELQHLQ